MQVISAFLAMQAIAVEDEKLQSILNELEIRISAMALVHEKLYKSKDLTNINLRDYLSDLANLLFSGFPAASEKVSLIFEGEDVLVTIDIAVPIGLVITELLTNSLKYAFPNTQSGSIFIRMQKHEPSELVLEISDNGIGAPEPFNLAQKNTIGIPTVLSIVRQQLRGFIQLDTSHGFNWKISFPYNLYGKRV
jgi:two-component sensor histidine kinase